MHTFPALVLCQAEKSQELLLLQDIAVIVIA